MTTDAVPVKQIQIEASRPCWYFGFDGWTPSLSTTDSGLNSLRDRWRRVEKDCAAPEYTRETESEVTYVRVMPSTQFTVDEDSYHCSTVKYCTVQYQLSRWWSVEESQWHTFRKAFDTLAYPAKNATFLF